VGRKIFFFNSKICFLFSFSNLFPLVAMPVLKKDDSKEEGKLSDYERLRLANIQRNDQLLTSLGLQTQPAGVGKKRSRHLDSPVASSQNRKLAAGQAQSRSSHGSRSIQSLGDKEQSDRTSARGNRKQPMTAMLEGGASASPDVVRSVRPLLLTDSAMAAGSSSGFARRVLQVVLTIPMGKVASYGQVAALAGSPKNARQVGKLLSLELGAGDAIPWQRVINSSGGISLPPMSGGSRCCHQHQQCTLL
jgi:methylated-DNA-protein-cysteine methyltransferase-like protein